MNKKRLSSLQHELGLPKPFRFLQHEALLNVYLTASLLRKRSTAFFQQYGLTDVQFNVLNLLVYQCDGEGLSQAAISRMMLVNRANVTALVDRMERDGLVERTAAPGDRRTNIVRLTKEGERRMRAAEDAYLEEVARIMGPLKDTELRRLVGMLERVREALREEE